eukprot:m.430192 g.430192  ORF g.430192 m.430192 type:complete len:232 (-) comp20240_c6_seq28:2752-3447(-)
MKLVFCCWYCEEPNVCLGCVCLNLFVNHVDTAMLQERDLTETTEHIMSNKVKLEQLEEALDTARQHIQVAVQKGVVAPLPVVKGIPSSGVHIEVPSVVTLGKGQKIHHAYQIIVTVNSDQWRVHRRYSQLHGLLVEMKKLFPGVTLPFPPKKTIGRRNAKLAEERRVKLEEFLQRIVAMVELDARFPLNADRSKQALLASVPFFGEETLAMAAVDELMDSDSEDFIMVDDQ